MIFTQTKLQGAFIIDIERREDSRGFFARAFCQNEFTQHGLKPVIAQGNIAFNKRKGTLRGMHFQYPPAAETKLVRHHTGYPGGLKTRTYGEILEKRPEEAIRRTVKGMIPKNRLGAQMLKKLKVYAGPNHPHVAQSPQVLDIPHARRSIA